MKLSYLLKAIPLFSTLLVILFLSISNQKEYTKLRILIWNTPSLTLGKYLAISTGTGFILSYSITTSLAKFNKLLPKRSLEFKQQSKEEELYENIDNTYTSSYDNTLIERDIKDPSPTINASFRIIGRTERSNEINSNQNSIQYDDSIELDDQYNDQYDNNEETINNEKSNTTDWNDQSFSTW